MLYWCCICQQAQNEPYLITKSPEHHLSVFDMPSRCYTDAAFASKLKVTPTWSQSLQNTTWVSLICLQDAPLMLHLLASSKWAILGFHKLQETTWVTLTCNEYAPLVLHLLASSKWAILDHKACYMPSTCCTDPAIISKLRKEPYLVTTTPGNHLCSIDMPSTCSTDAAITSKLKMSHTWPQQLQETTWVPLTCLQHASLMLQPLASSKWVLLDHKVSRTPPECLWYAFKMLHWCCICYQAHNATYLLTTTPGDQVNATD